MMLCKSGPLSSIWAEYLQQAEPGDTTARMGRKRRAWLVNGTGKRPGCRGYVVRWNDRSGTTKVQHSHTFAKLADAKQFITRYNAMRDLHLLGKVEPISIEEAVKEFLEGLAASKRAGNTLNTYAISIGLFTALFGAGSLVSDVHPRDIERFMSSRPEASSATMAKHWRALRRFFGWCHDRGYCEGNPAKEITARPRHKHVRAKPMLTEAQLSALAGACSDAREFLAVQLAVTTGLDRGTIAGLLPGQIDLATGTIHINRPKTGQALAIPVHPGLMAGLSWLVLSGTPGKPLLPQTRYRAWWGRVRERAGLPDLRFADLRAVASVRMRQVIDPAEAARILGHSTAVALQHYSPPAPAVREQLAALPLPGSPDTQQP